MDRISFDGQRGYACVHILDQVDCFNEGSIICLQTNKVALFWLVFMLFRPTATNPAAAQSLRLECARFERACSERAHY